MYNSVKLKNISNLIGSGITPLRSNPEFWDNGTIAWLKTEQLGEHKIYQTSEKITEFAIENTSIKIFPKNTLSIAMYGEGRTRGNVSILKSEMTTNQACCNIVIDDNKADFEYVYYFLKTQYLNLRSLSSGVRKNLNANDIKEFEIRIPKHITTQQKIAKVLSDLDAKIEINNKINSELEAMAKTLYDYWFVQFDFPDVDGKPYKTSGGKMVWNEELKREIPEGWEATKLEDLGNFKNGVNYDPSNPGQIACPIINVRNISASSYFIKNSDLDIIYLRENDVRKYSVHKGSIIIARSGIPGATRLISDMEANTLYCGFAIHYELVNLSNKLPIFFYLKSIEEMIKNGSGGTILKNVNQATLNNLVVAFPDKEIITSKFNKLIDPLFDKINLIEKENQQLASLRDWLLPMLMNGQVRVGDNIKDYADANEILAMVAEPVSDLNTNEKKQSKVISIKPSNVEIYKRTLLAAEIVWQLKDTNTLGHLKLQKMLYLCQEIESMNLPMNFLKQAMGPYDNQLARSLDKQFITKKWFLYQIEAPLKYKPLKNCGSHREDFKKYFEEEVEQVNYLINKFKRFTSTQIEVVVTLYACWKEALENQNLITDSLIISKFYQWSKEKEKFREENLIKALDWMRKNGVEPKSKLC